MDSSTAESLEGGARHAISVTEFTTPSTSCDPNMQNTLPTVEPKFAPFTMTAVPPSFGPSRGEKEVTVTGFAYSKVTGASEKSSPLFVTDTAECFRESCAGEWQMTSLLLMNTAETTELSNLHLSRDENSKLLPVTVTGVPPVLGPEEGRRSKMVTAG
jgi:hypothetical protein